MRLQKHKTRKNEDYHKYVVVIPKDQIEISGFKEGDELKVKSIKGEIKLGKISMQENFDIKAPAERISYVG